MKRMTPILFLGLLLSISSAALAGQGHGRDDHRGHHGDRRHQAHQHGHHHDRRHDGHPHIVRYAGRAPGHFHHGRFCGDWHSRGYVAPLVRYGYHDPGVVIVYQRGAGIYVAGGR